MGKINPATTKHELRQHIKNELQQSRTVRASDPIEKLAQWLRELPNCLRIASFASLSGQEPDLSLLHELLPNHHLAYPRIDTKELMLFHVVSDFKTLATGAFGIREPDPRIHPQVLIEEIDVFLCPGLAFGRDGSRLGRGGGYYDRVLAKARPDVLRVGICFRFQRFDSVPHEEHDILMTHFTDGHIFSQV